MTAVLEQHTVLPPKQHDPTLANVRKTLHAPAQGAALVGPDGSTVDLPAELYRLLRDVVDILSQGRAVTIAPHNTQLTTQEAADLLGISRPTLVKLLEQGNIPFELRGRHRRVMLADLVDYQQRLKISRRHALDEMSRTAAADGSFDREPGFPQTR